MYVATIYARSPRAVWERKGRTSKGDEVFVIARSPELPFQWLANSWGRAASRYLFTDRTFYEVTEVPVAITEG